jgi:superfamily II DNA or RNA helicase
VICAIAQLGREYLDVADLDTLVFATPVSAKPPAVVIEQMVGRILRRLPGKKPPVIVDFVDNIPLMKSRWRQRYKWYTGREYPIYCGKTGN